MNGRRLLFIVLLFFLAAASGCGRNIDKLPTLGMPDPNARLVDPPSITITPTKYTDLQIKVVLKYGGEKQTDLIDDRFLMMNSGTTPFLVEVRRGAYDDVLSKLKPGDDVLVYGRFEFSSPMHRYHIHSE